MTATMATRKRKDALLMDLSYLFVHYFSKRGLEVALYLVSAGQIVRYAARPQAMGAANKVNLDTE
jgi:hypothetical protein